MKKDSIRKQAPQIIRWLWRVLRLNRWAPTVNWYGVIREVFPEATMDESDYLLWNRTAYPFFGADVEHCLKQLREYKFTSENLKEGERVCDMCSNGIVKKEDGWTCDKCRKAWGATPPHAVPTKEGDR